MFPNALPLVARRAGIMLPACDTLLGEGGGMGTPGFATGSNTHDKVGGFVGTTTTTTTSSTITRMTTTIRT